MATWFAMLFLGAAAFLHDERGDDDTTNWPSALDATALRDLPSVHSITVFPVREPTRRIIHIINQHYLPRPYFKKVVRRVKGTTVSDTEIDEEYDRKTEETEAIQTDQHLFLQALVKRHRIRSIYFEGLPIVDRFRVRREFALGHKEEFATTFGAGGRLFLSGKLAEMRGIEPAFSISPAHPEQGENGWSEFLQNRDVEIVKALLSGDPVAILILGAGHDLSGSIKKVSHGSCEYIRVETKVFWEKNSEP